MQRKSRKTFLMALGGLVLFSTAWAADPRHDLNGAWRLIPDRSQLNDEATIDSGTVSINERDGNMYVQQNLSWTGLTQDGSSSLTVEGRRNKTVRQGGLTARATWENGVLQVKTDDDGVTTVERFSLQRDGTMMMTLQRPGHRIVTLFFERQ